MGDARLRASHLQHDPGRGRAALRPALKPGGQLLFCEHGRAPGPGIAKWQKRIEPLWRPIAGGCHLTRDVDAMLADAGWRIDSAERMYLPGTPGWAGYNVWGSARPAENPDQPAQLLNVNTSHGSSPGPSTGPA